MNQTTIKKIILVLSAVLFVSSSSYAENNGPGQKLERGVTNIATGWMEIFVTPYEEHKKYGDFTSIIGGIPLGIGKFIIRTVAGGYETVTFPIPDYDPVLTPEFLLQAKQNEEQVKNGEKK